LPEASCHESTHWMKLFLYPLSSVCGFDDWVELKVQRVEWCDIHALCFRQQRIALLTSGTKSRSHRQTNERVGLILNFLQMTENQSKHVVLSSSICSSGTPQVLFTILPRHSPSPHSCTSPTQETRHPCISTRLIEKASPYWTSSHFQFYTIPANNNKNTQQLYWYSFHSYHLAWKTVRTAPSLTRVVRIVIGRGWIAICV